MLEITYAQLLIFITIVWIIIRVVIGLKTKQFSIKRELLQLLVYICIIVISRFVYFELHTVNGKIVPLVIDFPNDLSEAVSLKPFFFLFDRYDGWKINIIGNITMFIPVGIVWPVCFKKLDTLWKTVLAGAGYTLLIELSKLMCVGRHSDVDDLILNTTGVLIGACIVFAIRSCFKKKTEVE